MPTKQDEKGSKKEKTVSHRKDSDERLGVFQQHLLASTLSGFLTL
jgi:hypothetical protein